MGIAPVTEGKISAVYLDLGRLVEHERADDLAFDWDVVGCDVVGKPDGPVLWIRPRADQPLVTVCVTVRSQGTAFAFGSKTVQACSRVDGLRTAICTAIRNIAVPSDPAAPLFSAVENPVQRIRDVSPSRLEWLRGRARQLSELATELETIWMEDGRMAGTEIDPDVIRRDRSRWADDRNASV